LDARSALRVPALFALKRRDWRVHPMSVTTTEDPCPMDQADLETALAAEEADLEMVVGSGVFQTEGQGLVLVREVEFFSLCEHHLLPFFGRMHVAYLPEAKIIGLSKIPRIIDLYARRFQVQERLTEQVADALVEVLAPRGALVVAEAQHMCMAMRGVQKPHALTVTRATRGAFTRDRPARQEVLSMLHNVRAAA
jgi:GTP cyclohydrolase I